MTLGYLAIRRKDVARHRRFMLSALLASLAFTLCFVLRYVRFGRTEPATHGGARIAYEIIWYSHEPIAVVSIPLVVAAAALGLRGMRDEHREVARMALPVWAYASVTGALIYLFVYVWPR